jgi:hypothetical protein
MDEINQTNSRTSKWFIWVIVILIVLGIIIYFAFFNGDSTIISSGSNAIPSPPALPE